MEYKKPEAKLWARKHLKGLEVPIFPSFTPDMKELDEEGIRFDVNHIHANGFTSVLAAPEVCGMTFEERERFVAIVCNKARGKMHSSATVLQDTVEEDMMFDGILKILSCQHASLQLQGATYGIYEIRSEGMGQKKLPRIGWRHSTIVFPGS